jgi:transposase
MVLSDVERAELLRAASNRDTDAVLALRCRMVLWRNDGRSVVEITRLASVTKPTVYTWLDRYETFGIAGLEGVPRAGGMPRVAPRVRARIIALSRCSPPVNSGLSHWSSREMAKHLKRHEGVHVSHNYIADLWRSQGLQPWRQGTFKLSKDPDFEAKVADVVGLYLDPPAGAVVLSIDEKTQVQALDRTQPMLPMDFGKTEKRTHDYRRHGVTNLFAALNVGTGEVHGKCYDSKTGADFLSFLKRAIGQYPGREIHVIVDNLSAHGTPEVRAWLTAHPNVTFHFTPVGSSWINQIETFFGVITRQAIRRGTFTSVRALIKTIDDYIAHWNTDCKPFTWTATPGEIIARVRWVEAEVRKLLDNNQK